MLGLTKMVAKEGGSYGITCNAIGPGPVKTPTRPYVSFGQDMVERIISRLKYPV